MNVYRVRIICLPAGSNVPNWEPEGWDEFVTEQGWVGEPGDGFSFTWPRRRNFFSESAALACADRFRRWGASVTVDRSRNVVFPSDAP